MKEPLIFDIKRASTSDGPGLRTVVFFKGCNLDCFWCHNPEGQSQAAQLAYFRDKCIDCGGCAAVCQKDPLQCEGACVEICPTEAKKYYGKQYTAQALPELIRADLAYYDATGGGVTFSGGECMLYPDFVADLARLCKQSGISVAIDTAGHVPYRSFEKVLPYADLFLYDVKCLDPVLHKQGTGVDNDLILQNLERLQKAGKQIIVRMPVVPHFNDGAEQERVAAFFRGRGLPLELLPYHSFGEDKRIALLAGRDKCSQKRF